MVKRIHLKTFSLLIFVTTIGIIAMATKAKVGKYAQALSSSINKFSLQLYREVAAIKPDQNVFMSPASVSVAMAMVHLGARAETANQIALTLNFKHFEDKAHEAYEELVKLLKKENSNFALSTANRLYPDANFAVHDEFLAKSLQHYQTTVDTVDFVHNGEAARQTINKWVEGETNQKIRDLIGPGVIDALTKMILVNAIYFKGNWADKFDPENTSMQPFFLTPQKSVPVDMMHKKMKGVPFLQDENCKVLMLPYKGGELSMVLVLPDKKDGLPALEQQMTSETLERMIEAARPATVNAAIPKFKLEVGFELSQVLMKLGMRDVFDDSKADLSGLSPEKDLYVSHVIHKAFVEVNEEGTEAAAATAAVIRTRARVIYPEFVADHSFLFIIRDNRTGAHLFIGRLMEPAAAGQQKQEL